MPRTLEILTKRATPPWRRGTKSSSGSLSRIFTECHLKWRWMSHLKGRTPCHSSTRLLHTWEFRGRSSWKVALGKWIWLGHRWRQGRPWRSWRCSWRASKFRKARFLSACFICHWIQGSLLAWNYRIHHHKLLVQIIWSFLYFQEAGHSACWCMPNLFWLLPPGQ